MPPRSRNPIDLAAACSLRGRLATAALAALLALTISPLGIAHLTGRNDLSFRVALVSWVLAAFVLVIAVAALATGRARQFMFYVTALALPFALLACLEAAAIAVNRRSHRADRGQIGLCGRGQLAGPSHEPGTL